MGKTLGDLNDNLFAQMERLNNKNLKGEELKEEITRAKAVTSIAEQIIANGSLVLEAQKAMSDSINANAKLPKMLEG